jgi:hypothetical protein
MSAVTILSSALRADEGTGSAVDVTAFSTLRLNWSVGVDVGRSPEITLIVETAPHATLGPWRVVSEIRMAHHQVGPYAWNGKPPVTLAGFDAFVRARWSGRIPRINNEQSTNFFTLALTGDGQPNAA